MPGQRARLAGCDLTDSAQVRTRYRRFSPHLSTKAPAGKPDIAEMHGLLDILQFSSDGIVVIDESYTIVATNAGVETVFGYDR